MVFLRPAALLSFIFLGCGSDPAGSVDAGLDPDGGRDATPATDGPLADAPAADAPVPGPRTVRVSVSSQGQEGNGQSGDLPTISGDGRLVVFTSDATNLVAGDTNGIGDLFIHDLATLATVRINVGPGGQTTRDTGTGWIARGGRFVCFSTISSELVTGDTNNVEDAFLLDRMTGTIERVSVSSDEVQGNAGSTCGGVSDDGRYVNFYGYATNLAGTLGATVNTFVRDRQLGTTQLVNSTGSTPGNGASIGSAPAPDGSFVVFESNSTNLIAGDTNGARDLFLRATSGGTPPVMITRGVGGVPANGDSAVPFVSGDGRFVAFLSGASNLVPADTNGFTDVFVYDRMTGTTERVSRGVQGAQANGHSENPKLSHDGRYVLFLSAATNLVDDDTNGARDVFLYDRTTATTVRVSVSADGAQANGRSWYASLSDDGRRAVFSSDATDLVPDDANGLTDVFVRELVVP